LRAPGQQDPFQRARRWTADEIVSGQFKMIAGWCCQGHAEMWVASKPRNQEAHDWEELRDSSLKKGFCSRCVAQAIANVLHGVARAVGLKVLNPWSVAGQDACAVARGGRDRGFARRKRR